VVLVSGDVIALLALGGAAVSLIASGTPALLPTLAPQPVAAAAFGQAMVFVMLAYGGFNDAATLSAEVRRPRDMTLALVGGMALVTSLYLLANWAYLAGLGGAGLAASAAPAAQLMARAFGPGGQLVMVIFVALAALAIVNALVIVGGRTLYAVATDEPALARLAAWDDERGVPRGAIWVQCVLSLLLIAWGSVSTGFAQMVDFLSPVFWLFLSLTGPALIILRRRLPDQPRPFLVPLYPWVPLAFTGACLFVLQSSLRYVGWTGSAISFGVLALGLGLRLVLKAPSQELRDR
jgi:basic amino acid/polyamine antiporter, APA family